MLRRDGREVRPIKRLLQLSKCKMMILLAMVSNGGSGKCLNSGCMVRVEQVRFAGTDNRV